MRIQNLVTKSNELIQWLDEHVYDLNLIEDAHSRSRLAVSCFYVALEHHRAIVLLISHNLHGSARPLIRILFDAFIRGLWLYRCASDDDLEYFKKKDKLKKEIERGGSTILNSLRAVDQWLSALVMPPPGWA